MTIKQLSVFVENKKGKLTAITKLLAENNIDISALSLADTSDFGVLRLIVNDIDKAKSVLKSAGITVKISEVLAIVMNDHAGACSEVLEMLSNNDITVEYMYACAGRISGKALMITKVDNPEKAQAVLAANGYGKEQASDIYRI